MPTIVNTDENRLLFQQPVTITAGSAGNKKISIPFEASYVAILNGTGASIQYAVGQMLDKPADIVTIQPYANISLPLAHTEYITLFWDNGASGSNTNVLLIFSNEPIPLFGAIMNPNGTAQAVTVTSGNIGVTSLPALPAGSNHIGQVDVNSLPALAAGGNNIGHVNVDSLPALASGTNTIGTVNSQQGTSTALNITAATVVKGSAGRIVRVSIVVAGTAAGSVNDAATTGAAAASNQIASIPNTVGVTLIDFPCSVGIVVTPGTGQTLAVSYV